MRSVRNTGRELGAHSAVVGQEEVHQRLHQPLFGHLVHASLPTHIVPCSWCQARKIEKFLSTLLSHADWKWRELDNYYLFEVSSLERIFDSKHSPLIEKIVLFQQRWPVTYGHRSMRTGHPVRNHGLSNHTCLLNEDAGRKGVTIPVLDLNCTLFTHHAMK